MECEVNVDISKEVVVSIHSEGHSKEALTVFNSIISCVMEAKADSLPLTWSYSHVILGRTPPPPPPLFLLDLPLHNR